MMLEGCRTLILLLCVRFLDSAERRTRFLRPFLDSRQGVVDRLVRVGCNADPLAGADQTQDDVRRRVANRGVPKNLLS